MFAVCGVFGHPQAGWLCYLMLHAMQHRMKRNRFCHIISWEKDQAHYAGGQGTVLQVFSRAELTSLKGDAAIGLGGSFEDQVSFYMDESGGRPLVLAVAGSVFESEDYRRTSGLAKTPEASLWMQKLQEYREEPTWSARLIEFLRSHLGVYTAVLAADDTLTVAGDPWGFVPLTRAELLGKNGELVVAFATESSAFAQQDLEIVSTDDLPPDQAMVMMRQVWEFWPVQSLPVRQHCSYGQLYVLHPSSESRGVHPTDIRMEAGRLLAARLRTRENLDYNKLVVVAVPDSGIHVAEGVWRELNLSAPVQGIIRNHYVPQGPHDFELKYTVNAAAVAGREVVLVDDSLIEGEVLRHLTTKLREYGVLKVHALVGPRVLAGCPARLAFQGKTDFIAARLSDDSICDFIGADTLTFLEVSEFQKSLGRDYCYYCLGETSPVF